MKTVAYFILIIVVVILISFGIKYCAHKSEEPTMEEILKEHCSLGGALKEY